MMKLLVLRPHVYQEQHWEAGDVVDVNDQLGAMLLRDYGPEDSDVVRRGGEPKFERTMGIPLDTMGEGQEIVLSSDTDYGETPELTPPSGVISFNPDLQQPPENPTPDVAEKPADSARDAVRQQTAENQAPTRPRPGSTVKKPAAPRSAKKGK